MVSIPAQATFFCGPVLLTSQSISSTKKVRRVVRLHVLVIGSRVSAGILTQVAAYTAFDKHDIIDVGEQLKIYARMFLHCVPREIQHSVIMYGIETIRSRPFDTFIAEIFENVGQ